MRIGVLSDTHLKRSSDLSEIETVFHEHFADVGVLLHAGDHVELEVFDSLVADKEFIGVAGNMDFDSVRAVLPVKRVVTFEGFRIGMIHGWGAPWGMEKRIVGEFEQVDCIVFGHTHQALCERHGDVLFFNPGSPTDNRFAKYRSIGFLELGDTIEGTIVKL